MAAEVDINGDRLEVGVIRPSFGPRCTDKGHPYDVSADGQRILALVEPEQKAGKPLTLA